MIPIESSLKWFQVHTRPIKKKKKEKCKPVEGRESISGNHVYFLLGFKVPNPPGALFSFCVSGFPLSQEGRP